MSILPIIVIFKRDIKDSESINSLLSTNDNISEIFVYNNSPEIVEIPSIYKGVVINKIDDYQNSGVSKAYNAGIRFAKENNYNYVLLLDQDTTLPADTLSVYRRQLEANKDIKLCCPVLKTSKGAICSPLRYKFHRGFPVKKFTHGKYRLKEYSPINSGMLINVDAAIECGGYKEDVFLDFSDFQFIERFKQLYSEFYVLPLVLLQDFSGEETDSQKLLSRFKLYCQCAKKCERKKNLDNVVYFLMVFMRMSKLILKTKKIEFLLAFYKNYIKG